MNIKKCKMAKVLLVGFALVLAVCFAAEFDHSHDREIVDKIYGSRLNKNNPIIEEFVHLGWKKLVRENRQETKNFTEPNHSLWPPRVKSVKKGTQYTILVSYLIHESEKDKKNLYCHISGKKPANHFKIDCYHGSMNDYVECTNDELPQPCEGVPKTFSEVIFDRVYRGGKM